jgi:hypothetical protein
MTQLHNMNNYEIHKQYYELYTENNTILREIIIIFIY